MGDRDAEGFCVGESEAEGEQVFEEELVVETVSMALRVGLVLGVAGRLAEDVEEDTSNTLLGVAEEG